MHQLHLLKNKEVWVASSRVPCTISVEQDINMVNIYFTRLKDKEDVYRFLRKHIIKERNFSELWNISQLLITKLRLSRKQPLVTKKIIDLVFKVEKKEFAGYRKWKPNVYVRYIFN